MVILIDLDETLVDLFGKWIYYFNQRYGENVTREGFSEYGNLDERWIDILRIPGFHADLAWIDPNAPDVLRRLREDGHRIIVVTAAVAWESARDKYSWVHTHLRIPGIIDGMKDLIITRDKKQIRGDILVDDRPNVYGGGQRYTICYDQPWNQEWKGLRAYDWWDVYQQIQGCVDEKERHRKEREEYEKEDMKVVSSYYSGGCY